jgi:hypothetical protein
MQNAYIRSGDELTVVVDSTPYTINITHDNFEEILKAIKLNNWENIPNLISMVHTIREFGDGRLTVDEDEGVVRYCGELLHSTLTNRILQMVKEGFTIAPLVAFLDNLKLNPSNRAVDELYSFLEYGKLPITDDGCFLAYKRVTEEYMDCHSHEVLNKMYYMMTDQEKTKLPYTTSNNVLVEQVAETTRISMPRNCVDDRSHNTCSTGLHFCSLEYLQSFGGAHVMILKINPRDVVSIPVDYNNTKGRCCMYEVVGEYTGAIEAPAFTTSVVDVGYEDGFIKWDEEDINEEEEEDVICDDMPIVHASPICDDFSDYISGYNDGYKAGRRKQQPAITMEDIRTSGLYDGDGSGMGYVMGYRDGRNHAPRKYK